MITRRDFIKYTTIAGVGFAIPNALKVTEAYGRDASVSSPALAKFVDPVPLPGVWSPVGTFEGKPLYQVVLAPAMQKFHKNLPPTTVWGYGGAYPGNTFVANYGEPIAIQWINNLPNTHLFHNSIDNTLMGVAGNPEVRTVTHVHGCEVEGAFDGGPFSWFLPGQSRIFEYDNVQQAATIWYHDHAMGITRLNVVAGLAGFFLVRDAVFNSLNLPSGNYEQGFAIQDRTVNANGSIFYPTVGNVPAVHPKWVPEYFGDVAFVNGKIYPFMSVEPRKYLFHLLNGSEARFYTLALTTGQPFIQIGTDGGLLAEPVEMTNLTFAPGERCTLILDFTGMAGKTITMKNFAPAPFPSGGEADIPDIMQFKVNKPLAGPDTSQIPGRLRSVYMPPEGCANVVRDIVLTEVTDPFDNPIMLQLNGKGALDPVTERPALGTTEIWRWINTTVDTHPMHTHLVMFRLLDRRPFNVAQFQANGQIVYTGPPVPPDANEMGWKDTVRVSPGTITRHIAKYVSYVGAYVYHCHILEHEENDMMRPFETIPTTYYFAEGSCRPNFDTYLCIQNNNSTDAGAKITYQLGNGQTKVQSLAVPGNSRFTIRVKDFLGEGDDSAHDFSALVENTNGVEIICERSMYFNYKGQWTGGHCVVGALSTANTWYFAEGTCRPDFDAFLTIQNPGNTAAAVKITYMLGNGITKVQHVTAGANARTTVVVKNFLGEGNDSAHDWSAKLESNRPIVAERSMYFNYQGQWTGGHCVVGSLGTAPAWYFAEGTCRPNFDPYLTIQNPNGSASKVKITYMKGDGSNKVQNITVAPHSRSTVRVTDVLGTGNDAAHDFSAQVETTNGREIICERPMYFNYNGAWTGGSCVMGSVLPFHRWYFAEGTTRPNFNSFISILNPDPDHDTPCKITYFLGDGSTKEQMVTVPKSSRATVNVADVLGQVDSNANDFSARVVATNANPIVCERPMYFNYNGVWTGGHAVVGFTY